MKPHNVRAVARKEVFHLLRDFRSLYLAFAFPLILILLFGYALSLDVDNIATVIQDQDHTPLSRDLCRRLDASAYFKVVDYPNQPASLSAALDKSSASLALVIPPGFAASLKTDRTAPLQVILDGSDPNFSNIARGYITSFLAGYNQVLLKDYQRRHGKAALTAPIEARVRVWFNEDLESRNFIVPGIIAVIIMIVGALLTSLVIAREYENGTFETLKSLPLSAGELLLGKAIPYFFIALADVLLAILMGQILFGIVMRASFWLMLLASCCYIAVAVGLGLLISIATRSQLIANQVAILVTFLPSLMLSNFVFPVANMPFVLQLLTFLVPARYYIEILSGLYLKNQNLTQLWPEFVILAAMAGGLVLAAVRKLKQEGL